MRFGAALIEGDRFAEHRECGVGAILLFVNFSRVVIRIGIFRFELCEQEKFSERIFILIEFQIQRGEVFSKGNFGDIVSEYGVFAYGFVFHEREFGSVFGEIDFAEIIVDEVIFRILCENPFCRFFG